MGKLYDIDYELERLNNAVEWNPEYGGFVDTDTGEILTEEEFDARFQSLQMEKTEILKYLAKLTLNERAEAAVAEMEEKRLKARKEAKKRKADRLEALIARECGGKTTDLGVATMAYRKSEGVIWSKEEEPALVLYLAKEHKECLKYAEPEVRKTELKALIKSGEEVPFARIEKRNNGKLK